MRTFTMSKLQAWGAAVLTGLAWVAIVGLIMAKWLALPPGLESSLAIVPATFIVYYLGRALRHGTSHNNDR